MSAITFEGPGGTIYTQLLANDIGRLGTADLGDGNMRVRLEINNLDNAGKFADILLWDTSPTESNPRFSVILDDDNEIVNIIEVMNTVGSGCCDIPAPNTFKGPGGTVYTQVFENSIGRIGTAALNSTTRIRIEIPNWQNVRIAVALLDKNWRLPTADNLRFSKKCSNEEVDDQVVDATAHLMRIAEIANDEF